jgi:hypothetical protein
VTSLAVSVDFYFGLPASGGDYFMLDDPVQGVLDSAYTLAPVIATSLSGRSTSYSVTRGRSRLFDQFQAGTSTFRMLNDDGALDPYNTAGPYYGYLLPGVKVQLTLEGAVVYTGVIEDIELTYDVAGVPVAEITCHDSLGTLALRQIDSWTTSAGQTAGQRLADMLDRSEIAFTAARALDAGVSVLQGDVVDAGTNALQYAQLVVDSDLGVLYADVDDVLTFHQRNWRVNSSPVVSFADDGSGFEFSQIERSTATDLFYNRVTVSRVGGSTETFTDPTWINLTGIRTLSLTGLLMNSDAQSVDMGGWLVALYADPEYRIKSITLPVDRYASADRATVLGLDLADLVNVTFHPEGVADPIDRLCSIEGISHDSAPAGLHLMVLTLAEVADRVGFVLDDPTFGVLDGAGLLGF